MKQTQKVTRISLIACVSLIVLVIAALLIREHNASQPDSRNDSQMKNGAEHPARQITLSSSSKGSSTGFEDNDSTRGENEGRDSYQELVGLLHWCGESVYNESLKAGPQLNRLLQLINAQGRDALLKAVVNEKDPKAKWAALSALCSMLSLDNRPLTSIGSYLWSETKDDRFIEVVQGLALDPALDARLRTLAIQAVGSFPTERAAPVLLALLGQHDHEADVFTLIEYFSRPLPEDVRSQSVRRAVEVLANPIADEYARGEAVSLLRNFPETIAALVNSFSDETSVVVRRGIALEGTRLVAEKPDNSKAGPIINSLLQIASNDADTATRCNILFSIGTEGVRKQYGDVVENSLLAIVTGSNPDPVRIAAVRALGSGGYTRAVEKIQALTTDPSPEVAKAAAEVLHKLKP